ncbi:hypothetical protein Ocin01_20244, partial [Orchesella cincta]
NLTSPPSYGITWALGNSVNPSQLEPAGEDKNGILYVARTEVNGEWVPGKGYYRGRTFYASVAFMGKEIESADCSVLLRGGTKWIAQQKNREIPNDAVFAGNDPRTHEKTYICRGFAIEEGRTWLIVGKVLENYKIACRLPFNGETSAFSFEVLVYYY